MNEKNFPKITGNPLSQKGFKTGKNINSMRVRLERPILDEFFKIVFSSKDFVNWTKLSEQVSCSRWTLKDIKLNDRTFPKKVFEELLQFIEPNKREYFLSNAKYLDAFWATKDRWNKKLMKIKNELKLKKSNYYLGLKALLCGYLAGDGTIFRRPNGAPGGFRYDIGFYPDELEMARSINDAFYKLYGRKFNIIKRKDYNNYSMRGTHKVAYFDLTKIASFGTHEWRVPFEFLKTGSMKSEWLRAFYDSEAHVGKRKIQVQSVNKEGMKDVKKLIESGTFRTRL